MTRHVKKSFDPALPVFVGKSLIANGRTYAPGMELDWRKLVITQRRIALMFEAGSLYHATPDHEAESAVVEAAPLEAPVQDEAPAPKDDLDDIDDMKELRRLADEIGAPYKVSKVDQRQVIREYLLKGDE